MPRCGILGIAVKNGQPNDGVQFAPEKLRKFGLIEACEENGYKTTDYGDIYEVDLPEYLKERNWSNAKHSVSIGMTQKIIAEKMYTIFSENNLTLAIGGDHTMAIGSVQGHLKYDPDICLIWVDAHADINLPFTSTSGNMHGMSLGIQIAELRNALRVPDYFNWLTASISSKNVAYLGLRAVDAEEERILQKLNITAFYMHDIERLGIATCLQKCLEAINPNMNRSIHLSLDIDGFDPSLCPSTGTSETGGLTLREGIYICEELGRTGLLKAVDLAEINPYIGEQKGVELTISTGIRLLKDCTRQLRQPIDPDHWLNHLQSE